jgi:hypothetical protein
MNNWNTIISFTYPHEAHLAKGKLESEGIEVFIKDELTAQVNNFYSNAIGGVKLLVKDSDYNNAYRILVESGYIVNKVTVTNKFWTRFDKLTSNLPLIGKSITELRLIILVALILVVLIIPIFLLALPSTREKLTGKSWCVEKIQYKGKELIPNSAGNRMEGINNDCYEDMTFNENGMAFLPGMNSYDDIAHWELRNDSLIISARLNDIGVTFGENVQNNAKADTVKNTIYLRAYKLEIKDNTIKLQSDSLIILGKDNRFNSNF